MTPRGVRRDYAHLAGVSCNAQGPGWSKGASAPIPKTISVAGDLFFDPSQKLGLTSGILRYWACLILVD
jgi:hypothetical protein